MANCSPACFPDAAKECLPHAVFIAEPQISNLDSTDIAQKPGATEQSLQPVKSKKQLRREKRLEAKWKHRRINRPNERKRTAERRAEEKRRICEEDPASFVSKRQERKNRLLRLEEGLKNGIRVAIDMSFCHVMSEKEITQLAAQVNFMYAATARSEKPFCLALTALEPDSLLERELYRKCSGFDTYKIIRTPQPPTEYYDRNHLIYLSPDADECLTSVEHDKVYVIGGIVDGTPKNRLTRSKCENEHIEVRRLPIQEFMQRTPTSHNTILTLNQVYNILITFAICGDWAQALEKHVPHRKGYVLRDPDEDESDVASGSAVGDDALASTNGGGEVGINKVVAGDDTATHATEVEQNESSDVPGL